MVIDKFRLTDQLAVITGGAGLLGRQHAQALLEAGAEVVLADINQDQLDHVCSELTSAGLNNLSGLAIDITCEHTIQEALQQTEKTCRRSPTILINNAAIDPKFDPSQSHAPSRFE